MSKSDDLGQRIPHWLTAIKHMSRELKQICTEETSARYAEVSLGLSNLVHLSFKETENAALPCT